MKKLASLCTALLLLCLTLQGALAAPVYLARPPFSVVTEELDNGDFTLTACGMKMTFTPMDVRFCLTQESSRYMFNNMGYYRDELLPMMEAYDIYAILYDRNRRASVQVHLYDDQELMSYAAEEDWKVSAIERVNVISNGWQVEESEVVTVDGLKLVRMLVTAPKAGGDQEWRLFYTTREGGMKMEIQLMASGRQIIDMVEDQVDAFVHSLRVEKLQEEAGQIS